MKGRVSWIIPVSLTVSLIEPLSAYAAEVSSSPKPVSEIIKETAEKIISGNIIFIIIFIILGIIYVIRRHRKNPVDSDDAE